MGSVPMASGKRLFVGKLLQQSGQGKCAAEGNRNCLSAASFATFPDDARIESHLPSAACHVSLWTAACLCVYGDAGLFSHKKRQPESCLLLFIDFAASQEMNYFGAGIANASQGRDARFDFRFHVLYRAKITTL